MSDSVVTSQHPSKSVWFILAVSVWLFLAMTVVFIVLVFYWTTRLNETEQMLVGRWAPTGDELTFAGEKFYYRFFADGTFDVFVVGEEENILDGPFGYWSANSKVITMEMKKEWDLQHCDRYVTREPVRDELTIQKLTTTELIIKEDDEPMTFKRLKK